MGLARRGVAGGGGATPTFIAVGTAATAASGNINTSWPAGLYAVGDTGILLIDSANSAPGVVSGWNLIGQIGTGTSGAANSVMLTAYWKTATSTSEAAAASGAAVGSHQYGRILVFRGCNASPIDASATGTGATSSVSLPAVTTTGANRLIVHMAADSFDSNSTARFSAWTNANLTSVTEAADGGSANGTGGGIGAAYGEKVAAGSTGAGSVTFVNGTSNYAAITIALKP